jgi:hypothetical protein
VDDLKDWKAEVVRLRAELKRERAQKRLSLGVADADKERR